MRLIFIFLAVVNLAFLLGHFLLPQNNKAVAAAPRAEIPIAGNLQLLSEVGAVEARPAVAAPGPHNDLCTMVGPFVQLLHAEYLVERLGALNVVAEVAQLNIKDGDVYWVYLAPEMSEKDAWGRLHELQQKNIESHLITRGELMNGISLGRYGDLQKAQAKKDAISAQGYRAEILTMPKMINETWVVIEQGSDASLANSFWSDVLAQDSLLEKRQNVCSGVASR